MNVIKEIGKLISVLVDSKTSKKPGAGSKLQTYRKKNGRYK